MTLDVAALRGRQEEGLAGEALSTERLSAVHRYLLDALHEDEPGRAVVGRLAATVEGEAILFGPDGEVEVRTAHSLPEGELWRALAGRSDLPCEVSAAGWCVYAVPVGRPEDPPAGWLAVGRRGSRRSPLERPAALCAAPLVAAARRLGDVAKRQEEAIRHGLLEELLRPDSARAGDRKVLAARIGSFGLRCGAGLRVVCLRTLRPDAGGAAGLAERLRIVLERIAAPHLIAFRDEGVIALVESGGSALAAPLAELTASGPGALAGVGREVTELCSVPESLGDANLALYTLARRGGGARTLAFEQLDLGSLIVAEPLAERVRARAREVAAALRAEPAAREALVAFLDHEQSVPAAARALFLHPNSLRYRLRKVEKIVGSSLKDPATVTTLYVSLAAEARDPALATPRSAGG
jgi:purine catabolism regulator